MVPLKSQGQNDFILDLFEKLLLDLTTRYPSEQKSFLRDAITIRKRVASEGVSFLSKTLPKLGKAFDRSLETHILDIPHEFHTLKNTNIPEFLQGMFRMCICDDGSWDPSPGVVRDIRQILFLVYKLELPYDTDSVNQVIDNFLSVEMEISGYAYDALDPVFRDIRSVICGILSDFDPKEVIPRHGPGAVATGEHLEEKWEFSRLYDGIHQEFPYYTYFIAGGARELSDRLEWYRSLTRLQAGEAKVVLVPKDSRGPRLISCEPLEYQWIQQGLGRALMLHLESNQLTKGRINFISQDVNAQLALESSLTRSWATLDLKDASDRVSLKHIDMFFPDHVRNCLAATRSASTKLPDGRVVQLAKFAPMGSALCFPVEALVFWAISVVAIVRTLKLTLKQATKRVFVYGDDIIVPTGAYAAVIELLERLNLKVNRDKSFTNGYFRESCGMDAYKGTPVTPVKVRTVWTGKPSNGMEFASYVEYANAFSRGGYTNTSQFLFKTVEAVFGRLPYGTPNSSFPSRNCHSTLYALIRNLESGFKVRWNPNTCQSEIKAYVLRGRRVPSTLDGWPRLLRSFSTPVCRDPSLVALPRSAKLSLRWCRIS
jgi:hypothetical protein